MKVYLNDGTTAESTILPHELYDLHKVSKNGSARIFIRLSYTDERARGAVFKALPCLDIEKTLGEWMSEQVLDDEPIPFTLATCDTEPP